MAFNDTVALFQARLQANLPGAAVGGNSMFLAYAQALLAAVDDTNYTIAATAPNLSITTAAGPALDTKAADYGVSRSLGVAATGTVQFSVNPAAAATITIPVGTVMQTPGDGITTIPISVATTAIATISSGQTTSASVAVQALATGTTGNAAAGTVTIMATAIGGVAVTNAGALTGGTNADTDPLLRSRSVAAIATKYTTTAIAAAAIAAGAYDAAAYDPQDGTGRVAYAWCDVLGNTGGLSGAGVIPTAGFSTASGTVGAGTLAALIDAAVVAVCPPGITLYRCTFQAGTIFSAAAALPVTYSAPSSLSSSVIGPQIQNAVVAYVQGLLHGQIPTVFGMAQSVQQAVGFTLTNFALGSTTPAIGAASAAALYRATGTAATLVSLTRV